MSNEYEEKKLNTTAESSEGTGIGDGWDTWSKAEQTPDADSLEFVSVTPDEFLAYQEETPKPTAAEAGAEASEEASSVAPEAESAEEAGADSEHNSWSDSKAAEEALSEEEGTPTAGQSYFYSVHRETEEEKAHAREAQGGARERAAHRTHKKRRHHHFFLYLGIILAAILALGIFLMSSYFTVTTVQVKGNHHYTVEDVQRMAGVKPGGNLFRTAKQSKVKEKLLKDPYFSDVKIDRQMPDTIVIEVAERKAVAAAAYGGKYIIIDADARVLEITQTQPKLTLIRGLTISKMDTGSTLEVEEKGTLKSMLAMLSSTEKGDFFFRELQISGSTVKGYITGTLVATGKYSLLKKSVEDGELQKVVNRLLKDNTKYGTIHVEENGYMSFSPTI